MTRSKEKILKMIAEGKLSSEQRAAIMRELDYDYDNYKSNNHNIPHEKLNEPDSPGVYDSNDLEVLQDIRPSKQSISAAMQTLDDLLDRDKVREDDGFPRRIKIGKIVKPGKSGKDKIVVVPSTTEPKFFHDPSVTEEEESTGGAGEGEEGEVIGEQQAEPQPGEGEGEGAGKGEGGDHDVDSGAFDLGKVLTEKFELPNLKVKGRKKSLTKYTYELTDRNKGFGQFLDKKETLKSVIKTNILLGKVDENEIPDSENMIISPNDLIYRILSKEKDFETQALVFFLRDYSGSMHGKPTEVVTTQHLFIYSWLVYQYKNNVETRYILHDTDAKEVPDFFTYHNSQVAGGTNIHPAYALVNKIIRDEQLEKDYNIYVFHGTDGDDWDFNGEKALKEMKETIKYANRLGITVAKNSWSTASLTTVEKYMDKSGLLKSMPEKIRLDAMKAADTSESRIIEGIKKLID